MNIQYNSACYLHKFVNFANEHENNGDAIAQFEEANNHMSSKISVKTGDHIRGVFNWRWHGAANAAGNDMIRQQFILNVLKCLGWNPNQHGIAEDHQLTQAEIKDAVNALLAGPENKARRTALLDALKVDDYGCGKPLTARRIGATLEQVKTIVESRAKRDDFWLVEGGKERLADPADNFNLNARILKRLKPDVALLTTPMGDDEREGANVRRIGNPPSDSNRIKFGKPVEGFKAGKLPDKLDFNGDEDVVGGDLNGEDDDDIRVLVDSGEEVTEKKQKIPVRGDISVQKNVSNEKDPDPDHLIIMTMMKARGRKSDNNDHVLHYKVCSEIKRFLLVLMDTDVIPDKNGISSKEFKEICVSLHKHMSDLSHDVPKGNLQTVVDILTKRYKLNVDDGVLRRVLLDVFKAYNEQQKDVELRVVIPEE